MSARWRGDGDDEVTIAGLRLSTTTILPRCVTVEGGTRGGGGAPGAPPGAARSGAAPGGRLGPPRLPSGPALVFPEAPDTLIFPVFFPEFLGHF